MADFYCKPIKNLPNNPERIKNEAKERRRNILYLILSYLEENSLHITGENLRSEAKLDETVQTCENIDLDMILQDYQSYYYLKFQKVPKYVRKLSDIEQKTVSKTKLSSAKQVKNKISRETTSKSEKHCADTETDFYISIKTLENGNKMSKETELNYSNPLILLEDTTEENINLMKLIIDQILPQNSGTGFQECIGLEDTIEILKESCVYPLEYPELFKNVHPWRGTLLYGPPGNGKTLLAKSLAKESRATFFNVTSSVFVSKWRGESEKMIKILFNLAKHNAPSIIFFDEIDALVSNSDSAQHEASRRFKSEILTQIDGILSEDSHIFVLATTNCPWNLDIALLRRLDKRVLVELPNKDSRIQMIKSYLKCVDHELTAQDFEEIGNLTDTFSGSDIKVLNKEIQMIDVREKIRNVQSGSKKKLNTKVDLTEVKKALMKINPSVNESATKKYKEWEQKYGAW